MRLTRSRDDVIVSGLLAGIGNYFNIDPTVVRIVVVVLFFATPFPVIPLYILGAIIVPKEDSKGVRPKNIHRKRPQRKSSTVRDFKEYDTREDQPSSRADEINEDDWSDF